MSYRREGDKNNFFFVAFLSIFLVTSTILLPIFTLTSTNNQITYEKSVDPNSNNSLVNSTLIILINSTLIQADETVNVEIGECLNITVFFRDNNSIPLNGATINITGGAFTYLLSEDILRNQYNFTLNTNDLEQGINILTIFAQLDGYQNQTIQFFIEVIEGATNIQLFLNGIDKTADSVLEIPIGALINITVKFYDNQTGLEIPNALVQLIGESLFENLTENLILKQYSIILNSINLFLGVKLFTIVAQAPTYQINTVDIRITVNRVSTSIDTVSGLIYIDINPGDDFLIQIVLNNTDFGGTIKNATVTYRWGYGQGILTDSNNDGIYEATLINVPAGSYRISINAYAGENYDFRDDFEIVLNAIAPPGVFILSSDAGNPDSDGTFYLLWISLEDADNYSIYVYNNNITQINSSLTLLDVQIDNYAYLISGLPDGTYYYIVVAFNEYGNASSNCIQVIVSGSVDEDIIPGYNLFTLIGILSIFSVIIIQKQLRHKNKRS